MTTPENIRAAAYLATRDRLDVRRTQKVKCKPPNRQCGNRCIPPGWDCRLKGEGEDGHLRAVGKGSDPVAGFANIERGLGRLRKGALNLSFSELEGGRRAIARGAAKLSPGDLKQKKELQERVNQFATYVGGPVALIVFAGLAHRGMKAFPAYARGPGAQVDATMSSVFRTVARNTPVYGRGVRAREAAGPTAINAMRRSLGTVTAITPENYAANPVQRSRLTGFISEQPTITQEGFPTEYANLIDNSLRKADGATNNSKRPSGAAYPEWERKSATSFWKTARNQKTTPAGVDSEGTVFSVIATNDHLARAIGAPAPRGSDPKREGNEIIGRIRTFFASQGEGIRTSMKELGLDHKSPEAVRDYIGRNSSSNRLESETLDILANTVYSRDYDTQAKKYYARVVSAYDDVFKNIVSDIENAPSIELVSNRNNPQELARLRQMRQSSFYNEALLTHSQAIGQRLNLPSPVYGTYTGLLAKRAYHTARVAGPRALGNNDISIELTRTEVFNAGIEIARATNLPEPATTEAALELVRQSYSQGGNALGRITLVTSRATQRTNPPRATTGQERPARRRRPRSVSELTAIYERAGYSPEAARARAQQEVADRRRRDARIDAYTQVREDFTPTRDRKGKPCGKSFIGKNEKCSKPGSKGYVNPEPGQNSSTGLMQNVGKVALAAGVVAGGVLAAKRGKSLYDNRRSNKFYTENVKVGLNRAIKRMSQDDVRQGLAKIPKQFRPQAEKLVGKAKSALAYMQADADGFDLQKVNNDSNFSVWKNAQKDKTLTIGSVGDTLVTFSADRESTIDLKTENGRGVGVYDVQFSTDLGFQQKKGLSKEDQNGISSMIKAMNKDSMESLPSNAVLRNIPFADDGLGKKRAAIYKRMKYKSIKGIRGQAMFATLDNGKVVAIDPQYEDFYADLLKGDDYDTAVKKFRERSRRDSYETELPTRIAAYLQTKEALGLRTDKKCGKSSTADNNKCTKPVAQRIGEAAGVTLAVGAAVGAALYSSKRLTRSVAGPPRAGGPSGMGGSNIPHPADRPRSEWHDLVDIPGVTHEALRTRRYKSNLDFEPINTATFSQSLRKVAGNTPEAELVGRLIDKRKIKIDSKVLESIRNDKAIAPETRTAITQLTKQMEDVAVFEGAFIDPNYPGNNGAPPDNVVWVNHRRKSKTKFEPTQEGVSTAIDNYYKARKQSLSTQEVSDLGMSIKPEQLRSYSDSYATYNTAKDDNRDFIIALHETGHALDIGFARRNRPPLGDREASFNKEIERVASHYALTNKDELFAEVFVLYTLSPSRFKKQAPSVYNWVDTYLKAIDARS